MKRIRDLIAGDTAAGNMLKLGGGTALGQLFSVLVLPIISRQYDPIQRGYFGIFSAFVAVATVVVGLRYEMATPSASSEKEADRLLTLSLLSGVLVSALSGVVFYGFHLANIGGYGNLPGWSSLLLVLTLVLTGAFSSLRFWFVRRADFKGISQAMIQQGFVRAVVPVLLGFLKFDWIGLAIGEVVGRVSGVFSLSKLAWAGFKEALADRGELMATAKKHRAMPLQMMPSSVLDSLALSLPGPLVFALFGGERAGHVSMALAVIAIPSGLITASVGDVFHQNLSELFGRSASDIQSYFTGYAQKLARISMVIYLPVALASFFLVEHILGANWHPLQWMLPAITPMVIVSAVVSPLSRLLVVVNRVDLKLYADTVGLASSVIPISVCWTLGLGFETAFLAFCLVQTFARLFYLWIVWTAANPKQHRTHFDQR